MNFFNEISSVFRFDVDTQLTTGEVKNFKLSSISDNIPHSLGDVSLNQFLPLNYNGVDELCVGFGDVVSKRLCLDVVTFRQFLNLDRALINSISAIDGLTSIGFFDDDKNLFIPSWFL